MKIFQDVPLEETLSPSHHLSVVVPDSRDSMLRLLGFVYTQQLVETTHEVSLLLLLCEHDSATNGTT